MRDKFNSKFLVELLKRLPLRVFWKDTNGIYLGCNDSFVRSLGLSSQDEIVGKDDFTLSVQIEEAEVYRKDDLEVIKSNQPKLNIEEEQTFPDGRKIYLLTSKVPFSIDGDNVNGIIGIYSDITELKLAQQQLEIEKEKAEVASESKTEFIANMSHDLRTPITGILGMTQDMLNVAHQSKSSVSDDCLQSNKTVLQDIIKTVERDSQLLMAATEELLQLCNEVLEVTQIESGISEYKIELFDLYELIRHNMELLKPTAQHKNLQLILNIDYLVPRYLKGSRLYLDRILLNLISNGLKFTKNGKVEICVESLKSNSKLSIGQDISIQIQVKDTGIGIPEDKFNEIFEHFSRLAPSYEGLYKGAGLGLYTVKRYIEAMGGTIVVSSEMGKGTCFTMTLPFIISDHADRFKESACFSLPTNLDSGKAILEVKDQESISTEDALASVLIVEDNKLAAIAVTLALRSLSCHVNIAESGAEAVKMAKEGSYDLILMDIGLPDFSGIEATEKIRKLLDTRKAQVPIVALTGHANNTRFRQVALDGGMQDVISKPAQPLVLESILQAHVFRGADEQGDLKIAEPARDASKLLVAIDWDTSVRMCNGDVELLRELILTLDTDLITAKKVLAEAYTNRDTAALCAELHRTQGGVCYLKLPELEYGLKVFYDVVEEVPQDECRLEKRYEELMCSIDNFKLSWRNYFNVRD